MEEGEDGGLASSISAAGAVKKRAGDGGDGMSVFMRNVGTSDLLTGDREKDLALVVQVGRTLCWLALAGF